MTEPAEPHERLFHARENAGYDDAAAAARAFGWNVVTYRAHEAGTRGLKPKVVEQYATAFRTTAAWIMHGVGSGPGPKVSTDSEVRVAAVKPIAIFVAGTTEAGAFREVVRYDDDQPEYVFEEQDPEFPDARMSAYDVSGDSMNDADPPILPGARIVCVDFGDTGLPLSNGMIVVVERVDLKKDRREWSVKEVEIKKDRTIFHPRSKSKRHKPFEFFDDPELDGGETVTILGLVRSVIYAVASGRRRNPRNRF